MRSWPPRRRPVACSRCQKVLMPWCTRAVCAFTLLASSASAQSTTEDGMRAMLRGDYSTAVRILRPIADSAAPSDPVAQFLLGILTDTGHTANNTRACGLFLRGAKPSSPVAEQSAALAARVRDELGDGAS